MADEEITLTEILGAEPVPFEVDGVRFYIRQPYAEEYDDAGALYDKAYAKAMSDPDVKALKVEPCSDAERQMYVALAALDEAASGELPEDSEERKAKLAEAGRLRKTAETRTAAEELAHDRALTVKERWLCLHLLCDANGNPVFDATSKQDLERWRRYSLKVKESARPAIRRALRLVNEAPFA
jgi:hypothetical protein